jgi:hypothetical protein
VEGELGIFNPVSVEDKMAELFWLPFAADDSAEINSRCARQFTHVLCHNKQRLEMSTREKGHGNPQVHLIY